MACLTNTLRSQRFSRSQRLSPTVTLRLCFTPHPPLGFRSSELSSTRVSRSTSRCPLLSCRWYQHLAKVFSTKRPRLPRRLPLRLAATARIPRCHPATQLQLNIIDDLGEQARLLHRERPNQNQAWLLSNHSGHDLHHKTARMLRFRRAWAPTSEPCSDRASVPCHRFLAGYKADALLTFPSPRLPHTSVGLAPSPQVLPPRPLGFRPPRPFSALQGVDPTVLGRDYVSLLCLPEVFHLVQLVHIPQAQPVAQPRPPEASPASRLHFNDP